MTELRDIRFHLAPNMTPAEVSRRSRARFSCRRELEGRRRTVFYDSFDWRLHRQGGYLAATFEEDLVRLLWKSHDGTVRHRLVLAEGKASPLPSLVRDFPTGAFRRALEPVLEMRRLLPVAEVGARVETLHLLDDQEKTVARLSLAGGTVGSGSVERPMPVTVTASPVRGYGSWYRQLTTFLERELGLPRDDRSECAAALGAVGRRAGDYTSKLRLELDPETPADATTAAILQALFAGLLANEDGTRRDLDSEFLHDFRVSVRRMRSALSQIKGIFPPAAGARLRDELRWLQGVTGPTRDLDVYLLKMDTYRTTLPSSVQEDLRPLEDFLRARQRREHQRLVAALDTDRYRRLIDACRAFLDRPSPAGATPPVHARRPIRGLASERIWRSWRRVWRRGRAIGAGSPAEALHRLRIDCKKLRYLLEFFRSLYATAEIEPLVRTLKQLQDNLGDFNDYEVQQQRLREFAHQMQEEGCAPVGTFMAMGRLVMTLQAGQQRERHRFAERFARFTHPDNRRTFRRLFGTKNG